ncbi:hypothetical protein Scep_024991 [Stephania cephalantha]|uniref:Copper transport protein n=1 Tax=Stephania cephalantha TaxID=152367 RepID=A0AAP0EYU7_9MAGN
MMHMTFYWGKKVTLLFDSWRTDSWPSYGLTLLACLLFSIFYQYMEDRRIRFKLRSSQKRDANLEAPLVMRPLRIGVGAKSARFASSVLFGVNSAIGYLLMLAIMSFNGGVFVAVVLGLAIGYLVFRSGAEEVLVLESPCACA